MAVDLSLSLRTQLVSRLSELGLAAASPVARAFESVPREAFVHGIPLEDVYQNSAITTKTREGFLTSSSSQPSLMARMLNRLDVQPGQNVLEVGTGTGYNAALLAELVGTQGAVTTVDIDSEVAVAAASSLNAAGYQQVEVVAGDGGQGFAQNAPYDRIIVTAGSWQIPPAWTQQLHRDGGMVLPLRVNGSALAPLLRPDGHGLSGRGADPCSFIALAGAFAGGYDYELPSGLVARSDRALRSSEERAIDFLLTSDSREDADVPDFGGAETDTLAFYHYLQLQGFVSVQLLAPEGVPGIGVHSLLLTSPRSALGFGEALTVHGTSEAQLVARDTLQDWRSRGSPSLDRLRIRVEASSQPLAEIPALQEGKYRFRRGPDSIELWYDS